MTTMTSSARLQWQRSIARKTGRPRTEQSMPPGLGDGTQRVVLYNIPWQNYKTIADAMPPVRSLHLTYDRGTLEIMSTSPTHGWYQLKLVPLILGLALGLRRPIGGFGSFTHQREDLSRALEPDLCFYVANLSKVRGKKDIDLAKDPPPDLTVEIEISRSFLDRMSILAALGVPEVWCFDGEELRVYLLEQGAYKRSEQSLAFPEIPIDQVPHLLSAAETDDDNALYAAAAKWAQKYLKRQAKRPKSK